MGRPLAICCRISALGLRSPRSIWLRYGLDTPANLDSWRKEICAWLRCWRMYSPMSLPRSATKSMGPRLSESSIGPPPSRYSAGRQYRPYAALLAVASGALAAVVWYRSRLPLTCDGEPVEHHTTGRPQACPADPHA